MTGTSFHYVIGIETDSDHFKKGFYFISLRKVKHRYLYTVRKLYIYIFNVCLGLVDLRPKTVFARYCYMQRNDTTLTPYNHPDSPFNFPHYFHYQYNVQ